MSLSKEDYITNLENFQGVYIRICKQRHITDVKVMNFKAQQNIKVLQGKRFIDRQTGEEKVFMPRKEEKVGNRNKRSLLRAFDELGQTINANFASDLQNQLSITLTYAENMTDAKKAYKDFDAFYKRFKRAYPDHKFEYLTVMEPQGRGAWHFHLLLKTTNQKELFIPDKDIRRIWGHGITKTERLHTVDNYGMYFTAYFRNLEIPEGKVSEYEKYGDIEEKNGKRYIKGKRLEMYPESVKIWRHSEGIKKPKTVWGQRSDLEGLGTLVYDKVFEIPQENKAEDEKPLLVRRMQFNSKRKKTLKDDE